MTRILRTLSLLAVLFLAACAGSNQVPATAVDVPAYALPPAELQKSASHIIRRGQFKGNYNSNDHPIRLLSSYTHPQCLFMYDGSTSRPRNVINKSTYRPNSQLLAIGFHRENSTCSLEHTDWLVPYVFAEIAYRRMPDLWFFVAKAPTEPGKPAVFLHCRLSRLTYDPESSWCEDPPRDPGKES